MFCTRSGRAHNRSNVRRRVLVRANERLREAGEPLLPALSPHALRHTFASLLFEAGATVPYVMAQLGHADPKVTLGIYAHVLRRKGDTGERLDALVRAADWAATGSDPSDARPVGAGRGPTADEKTAY